MKLKPLLSRPFFRNLIASYAMFLVILFLIYIAAYSILNNVVTSEVERVNSYLLTLARTNIDNELIRVEQLATQIAAQSDIVDIYTEPHLGEKYSIEKFRAVHYLKNIIVSNDSLKDIYIYEKGSNSIISASRTDIPEIFFEYTHKTDDFTYEMWIELMENTNKRKIISLPSASANDGGGYIAYIQSLPVNRVKAPNINLVILIDKEKIIERTQLSNEFLEAQLLIIDKYDNMIMSYGDVGLYDGYINYGSIEDGVAISTVMLKKDHAIVNAISSQATSWKYIIAIPKKIYKEKINFLNWITLIGVLIYFIVGGAITFIFAKKNYAPIDNLISGLQDFNENIYDGTIKSEFKYIFNKINSIYKEKQEIAKVNSDNVNQLRDNFLKGLLDSSIMYDKLLNQNVLERYNIETISDKFAVLLIKIENAADFTENSVNDMSLDLIRYAIGNVVENLIVIQRCKGYVITISKDSMVATVNFPPNNNNQENKDALNQLIIDTKAFFEKHYHTYMCVAVSGDYKDFKDLNICFKEAMQALDYRFVKGCNQIIYYNDICDKKTIYMHDVDLEQILINHIKNADFYKTKEIIDNMFNKNVYSNSSSYMMSKCFIFDIVSIITSIVPQEYMFDVEKIAEDTAPETHEKILDTLAKYCNDKSDIQNIPISSKIIKYISENYQNADIDVGMMGNVFNLVPSYLSKLFKEQTGESLINYLHKYRIKKSKEILPGKKTIEEIACSVGYINSNAYIRIFKKFEGITPGQYREQLKI